MSDSLRAEAASAVAAAQACVPMRLTVNCIRYAVADVRAHCGGLPPMTQCVIRAFARIVKSSLSHPSRQTVGAPSLAPPKDRLLVTVLMTALRLRSQAPSKHSVCGCIRSRLALSPSSE